MLLLTIPLNRFSPEIWIAISCSQRLDINLGVFFRKFKLTDQIHILPGNGRCAFDDLDSILVAGRQFLLIHPRQGQRVVVDDGVDK